MRKSFAPQEGETVESLEKRMVEASAEREELLEDEDFSTIPEQYVEEFEKEFNISIGDAVVACDHKGKRLTQMAQALFEGKEGEVRVLNITGTPDQDTVTHELIHAVMADNPLMAELFSEETDRSNKIFSMLDIFYMPLPCSPYDKRFSFVEAVPAALLNDKENVLTTSLSPFTNGLWGFAAQPILAAVLSRFSRRAAEGVHYLWLCSGATRLPRLVYATAKSIKIYHSVSEMKERLGKQETLKLLTFADDEMVEQIVKYIKQEDIRF